MSLWLSDDTQALNAALRLICNERRDGHAPKVYAGVGGPRSAVTHAPQDHGHDGDYSDIPGSEQIQDAVRLLLLGV